MVNSKASREQAGSLHGKAIDTTKVDIGFASAGVQALGADDGGETQDAVTGCAYGTVFGSGFMLFTPPAPQNLGYGMTGQSAVDVSNDICGDFLTARLVSNNQGNTENTAYDLTSGYYSAFATRNTTTAGYFHMESRYSYYVYNGSVYVDNRETSGPTCYSGYAYPDGC
jgi:hypothetical protein